jgi:hypothetical protein
VPRWQRAFLVACAVVIGGTLAIVVSQYAGWPRLSYHAYRRSFDVAPPSGSAVEASYIGISLWAVAGALVAALAAVGFAAAWRRPLAPASVRLLGAWALTSAGLAGLYSLWTIWPF